MNSWIKKKIKQKHSLPSHIQLRVHNDGANHNLLTLTNYKLLLGSRSPTYNFGIFFLRKSSNFIFTKPIEFISGCLTFHVTCIIAMAHVHKTISKWICIDLSVHSVLQETFTRIVGVIFLLGMTYEYIIKNLSTNKVMHIFGTLFSIND